MITGRRLRPISVAKNLSFIISCSHFNSILNSLLCESDNQQAPDCLENCWCLCTFAGPGLLSAAGSSSLDLSQPCYWL